MFNEKTMTEALSTVSTHLKDAICDRDQYRQWWLDEKQKREDRDATIEQQHAEIVRLTEEANNLRPSEEEQAATDA